MNLTIKNVSVSFRKKVVLNNISLSLQPGVYGLIGENGAGKTTLFRSILGLQKYKGTVTKTEIFRVGYVPQKFDCLHGLSVNDTLKYFCCLNDVSQDQRNDLIERVLEQVNLKDEKNKKVRELSGGMLRRLGIAQALIDKPELLIMDEPTVGLDPAERVRLRNIIELIKKNRIILISSHEIRELEHICDNFIFIKKGNIIHTDSIQNLFNKYNTTNMEDIYFRIIEGGK